MVEKRNKLEEIAEDCQTMKANIEDVNLKGVHYCKHRLGDDLPCPFQDRNKLVRTDYGFRYGCRRSYDA